MAGRPKTQRAFKRFDAQEDAIWAAVESAISMRRIAKRYGGVSRQLLYQWINKDPERKKRFLEARQASADALVDEAGEILDGTAKRKELSTQHVQAAKERARHREWKASRFDRATYGDTPSVSIGFNLDADNLGLTWVQVMRGSNGEALPHERPALPQENGDEAASQQAGDSEGSGSAKAPNTAPS